MIAVFSRLLSQTAGTVENDDVKRLGRNLITQLTALLNADETSA